jgi:hypothetical protein
VRPRMAKNGIDKPVLPVGVTGHRKLGDDPCQRWYVHAQCVRILDRLQALAAFRSAEVVAYTSLAVGADQLFAQAALGLGMPVVAVLPFVDYSNDFDGEDRAAFEALLQRCRDVRQLDRKRRSNQAYLDAGLWIVDEVEYLVAVWNGLPAAGKGGTADVVAYAVKKRCPVLRIDPAAAPAPMT